MRRERSVSGLPLVALLAAAAAALPAASAAALELELTPLFGYRSADYELRQDLVCAAVYGECSFRAAGEDGPAWGLALGAGLGAGWQLELLANHQAPDLEARGRLISVSPGFPDVEFVEDLGFDVTHLQLGASRTLGEGPLRPFLGAAVGVSRVEIDTVQTVIIAHGFPVYDDDVSEDALSASAGGGVKVDLSERLGLRLEGRAWWVDLAEESGGEFTQIDALAGLILRF